MLPKSQVAESAGKIHIVACNPWYVLCRCAVLLQNSLGFMQILGFVVYVARRRERSFDMIDPKYLKRLMEFIESLFLPEIRYVSRCLKRRVSTNIPLCSDGGINNGCLRRRRRTVDRHSDVVIRASEWTRYGTNLKRYRTAAGMSVRTRAQARHCWARLSTLRIEVCCTVPFTLLNGVQVPHLLRRHLRTPRSLKMLKFPNMLRYLSMPILRKSARCTRLYHLLLLLPARAAQMTPSRPTLSHRPAITP